MTDSDEKHKHFFLKTRFQTYSRDPETIKDLGWFVVRLDIKNDEREKITAKVNRKIPNENLYDWNENHTVNGFFFRHFFYLLFRVKQQKASRDLTDNEKV